MPHSHRSAEGSALPRLLISLPSLLFWLAVALFDRSLSTAASLVAATLHELGHIAVMHICGMRVTSLTVLPYGLEISSSRPPVSFREDIAISSAGCAVNFITAPVFYAFGAVIPNNFGYFLLLISASSVLLGILNALPVSTLDGGAVLEALLALLLPAERAYTLARAVGFFSLLLLWVLSVYVFLFSGYNYSLFAMSLWLFARLFC